MVNFRAFFVRYTLNSERQEKRILPLTTRIPRTCVTRRWIKFEEDVEEGGNRWSKPHVATLSLHSLFELRSLLLNGTVMLDMEAASLEQIADLVLDNMINSGVLPVESREKARKLF